MSTPTRLRGRAAGFLRRLLCTGVLVCGLGMASEPAHAAGTAVTIDTAPLIIQAALPPNIMLMLDDSGSMAWDFMPDWKYLGNTTVDGLRNASINGVYYNPKVTYTPPPQALGGTNLYNASPDIVGAYKDGFLDTSTTDVRSYSSPSANNRYAYYTQLTLTTKKTYAPTCPSDYTLGKGSSGSNYQCIKNSDASKTSTPTCASGDTLVSSQSQCQAAQLNYFTYTTGSVGSFVSHYVGADGDCQYLSTSQQAVCDHSAATRQNVANWFSYYRTRILMAKSGLMSAFATIDPKYRVGFASINNRNTTDINATGHTSTIGNYTLAQVQPFGDGKASTQRANFWTWVNDIQPNNSTPLRVALDAVGQYYQSDQPWLTDPLSSSSGELACRASYTILTTDGFWNEDDSLVSGIGDVDGVAGKTVTGPNQQSYTYVPVLPYADSPNTTNSTTVTSTYAATPTCDSGFTYSSATDQCTRKNNTPRTPTWTCSNKSDSLDLTARMCTHKTTVPPVTYSNTLSDVAMKYWRTDLRPNTKNEVPVNAEDNAFWQHMTTFTLGLGFQPLYADQVTPIPMADVFKWAHGDATKAISGFAWPQPTGDSINNIADLAHAAVNGHGGFYSATSPESFADGLKDALKRAAQRTGTGASLAANSTQLQTGTVAYQANYYTASWKGDLKALAIDATSGAIAATPSWSAANKMPAASARTIYTYNPASASTAAPSAVAFKVDGSGNLPALSSTQLAALGGDTASQAAMINYLRGDSSKEVANGGSYRSRDTSLGDIVNSQPVYVGAPSPNQFNNQTFSGSTTFSTYASDQKNRAGLIYVAANDGMLHAFNAGTGIEAYAYLPGAVIANGSTKGISDLANTDYGTTLALPHQFFNDGELTVADVYSATGNGTWKTVLVGTTGRGQARAVYAFDVTDPANIQFLWERSASDGNADGNSKYIGQMTGKPVIAQTSPGVWSVLMGNGYNSAGGVAALLQFNVFSGALSVHQTTDTTGLAAPAVWISNATSGISDMAYAGDLNGNVWSFALNTGPTNYTASPNTSGTLLFTAKDANNVVQPITGGLLVGKNPQTQDVWVFFGTGQYLTNADLSNLNPQSWYGLIVKSGGTNKSIDQQAKQDRSSLVQRYITTETTTTDAAGVTTSVARTVTTTGEAASMTGKSGWYMNLLQPSGSGTSTTYKKQGERMVTPNQFQGNLLLGTTRIPQASDLCDPSGTGWVMAVDPFTGTNPQSNFFDINGDGQINAGDAVNGKPAGGMAFSSLPNNPIFVGGNMLMSFDNGTTGSIKTSSSGAGMTRVSWRELINQ
ncbi:pilus assembly protein [Dyella japonica]|uniref:Pilus assembly protein PilY n=1 Tax=Dyella japonica A8 TaxID=1217721 RepID=A0A075K5D2_9GAMM|nr:PilC/PilY family type IV pilus protein [Dyella japonica]AIF48887.1 pilus assembly protein PilY [Dyella japonica A8]